MRKTTPLLVQLDGQSLGDVTVSIDESKITPEIAKLNSTATTISTTTISSNKALGTVAERLTAKNSTDEDKSVAQAAVDACTYLETLENSVQNDVVGDLQSADGKTTIFDCASATVQCLVDDPTAPAADQVKVGAAVKRIRDTVGQSSDAETENTAIGLLKKIKANTEGTGTISGTVSIQAEQLATLATEATQAKLSTEATLLKCGTEATLATRASEATLATVHTDTTAIKENVATAAKQDAQTTSLQNTEAKTTALAASMGTAADSAGTNTVIGLLKGIAAKFE